MVSAMKRFFARFKNLDEHLKELIKGAMTAASLKVVAALATFGLHLFLGRMLGPDGTGIYFLAFTIITIAANLARFGLDNTLVRIIATSVTANQPERIRGIYRFGFLVTVFISFALAICVCLLAPWLAENVFKNVDLIKPLQIMALAIPSLALSVIHAQALQGLKKIRDAIATLSVVTPVASILILYPLISHYGVSGAVTAYLISAYITLGFGVWRWRKSTNLYLNEVSEYSAKEILRSSIPLFWVMVINMLISWLSTLMLGAFATSYEVGLFSAANRVAMLVSFVLVAINSIAAPKFAALYAQGDMKTLRKVANASNRIMILLAFPVLVLFAVFPEGVLKLFGAQFIEASLALSILAIGQFVNVTTGSVAYLLMMAGHEKVLRNNLVAAAVISVVLNVSLIPLFGVVGAATATALTMIIQNSLSFFSVRNKIYI